MSGTADWAHLRLMRHPRALSFLVALAGIASLVPPSCARADQTAEAQKEIAEENARAARRQAARERRELIRRTLAPQSPCKNATIRPNSNGLADFRFHSGVEGDFYAIEFGTSTWETDSVKEGLRNDRLVSIDVMPLLFNAKTWYWRVRADKYVSGSCRFSITPAEGAELLPPPKLTAPTCGATVEAAELNLDATSSGNFQTYAVQAEVWYPVERRWKEYPLVDYIDKSQKGMEHGFHVTVSQLPGKKWRWRARLATEKMPPIFANQTRGMWSEWCPFDIPRAE